MPSRPFLATVPDIVTSIGGRIVRGAAIVSAFTLLGKVLGFVQKQIMAYCFGTGTDADAYVLAFQSIGFAFSIIPQKSVAPFLPLFMEKLEKHGEAAAWRLARTVGLILAVLLGAAVTAGMLGAPLLVRLTADFQHTGTADTAVSLVRILLPASFFLGLASLFFLVLHSYKRFAIPASGDVLNRILVIAVLLLTYRALGIRALAAGVVLGAAACLLLQIGALWPRWRGMGLSIDLRDPALRTLARLIPPVLVGAIFAQVRTILDFRFASAMGEGFVSSLSFAKVVPDTLTLLVPFAVGVSIYPFFADLSARDDRAGLRDTLMGALRLITFVFAPLAAGLILLRVPVLQLAFERGEFGRDSLALTSGPFLWYSLGLPIFAAEIILMQFYFAIKDTKTPVLIGIAALVVHVTFIVLFQEALLHKSIALAATISKTLKVAVMLALLRGRIADLQARRNAVFLLKTLLAVALMVALVLAVQAFAPAFGTGGKGALARLLSAAWRLGPPAAAGMLAYAAASRLLGMSEYRVLLNGILARKRRSTRA